MFSNAKPCHEMPLTSPSTGKVYDNIMKSMYKTINNSFNNKLWLLHS